MIPPPLHTPCVPSTLSHDGDKFSALREATLLSCFGTSLDSLARIDALSLRAFRRYVLKQTSFSHFSRRSIRDHACRVHRFPPDSRQAVHSHLQGEVLCLKRFAASISCATYSKSCQPDRAQEARASRFYDTTLVRQWFGPSARDHQGGGLLWFVASFFRKMATTFPFLSIQSWSRSSVQPRLHLGCIEDH